MNSRAMLASVLLAASTAVPATDDLAVAWLRGGTVESGPGSQSVPAQPVPLGSLWKLFVYAYAWEHGLGTEPYRCGPSRAPGEEYCCEPGESIELGTALARSCGPAFAPARLGIGAASWHSYWAVRTGPEAAWLADLSRLVPETREPVPAILHAVAAIPPSASASAQRALLAVTTNGHGRAALPDLGGGVRVKTFTWAHPWRAGITWGGGSGWLVDGTPVWFAATGSSRTVLAEHSSALAAVLPAPRENAAADPCVVTEFFARHPVAAVDRLPERTPAPEGPLAGRFRVRFVNGNTLVFTSGGEMVLGLDSGEPRLRARLTLTEYLGRVLDREADPTVTEAARALAVTARTWLLENAAFEGGCYRIEDSSRAQRVAASPASPAALAAVRFTDGLVLDGQPAGYRRETSEPGLLSWAGAVAQARAGYRFDRILAEAFPRAVLATGSGERECRRLADAEAWLARRVSRWHRVLAAEPGFDPPGQPPIVCALTHGQPYTETTKLRVHVRGVRTADERIALAHEYVHVAFRFHPRGTDERFVEALARRLEGD